MGLSSSSLKNMIGFEIRINNREPVIITSYDVAFVMVNCNYSFDDNIYIGVIEDAFSGTLAAKNAGIGCCLH